MKNGERLRMKEHGVKQTSFAFALWVVQLAKDLQEGVCVIQVCVRFLSHANIV